MLGESGEVFPKYAQVAIVTGLRPDPFDALAGLLVPGTGMPLIMRAKASLWQAADRP